MATRQNSSNGKPKSPRIQVVLPEKLCDQLTALADMESRTVSNMAKVLIQKGVLDYAKTINELKDSNTTNSIPNTENFRTTLESQKPRRLRGAPRRVRLYRP